MSNITAGQAPMRRAERQGESLAQSKKMEWLARAGLAARGVTYFVVGLLAIKLALGDGGGKAASQQGALKTIAAQPFGKVLLILVAIGLFGYAAWRLLRAAIGHGIETGEDDTKERLSCVVSGVAYGALFVTAVKILTGSGTSGGQSGKTQNAAGGVFEWPGGVWIVGIVGVVIVGVGLEQGVKAYKMSFLENAKTEQMSEKVERTYTAMGVFGHFARMVVFCMIGYFLLRAAIDYSPKKAVALDGVLGKLEQASYGPILLGVVAAGLIGFAAYSAMDARYRRV